MSCYPNTLVIIQHLQRAIAGVYRGDPSETEIAIEGAVELSIDENNILQLTPLPIGLSVLGPDIGKDSTVLQKEHCLSVTHVDLDGDHDLCHSFKHFWETSPEATE